jgi:hypothetical protein
MYVGNVGFEGVEGNVGCEGVEGNVRCVVFEGIEGFDGYEKGGATES